MRLTFTLIGALLLSAMTYALTQPAAPPAQRFDFAVRADFFAGFAGDMKRFDQAMALCEDTLAKNPDHAEALVWHGSGLVFQAGMLFQKGDVPKGMELWGKGLGEMNRAVALAPDDVAVRIPRGASLFEASRHVPPPQDAALLKLALSDYEQTLAIQEKAGAFARLSPHAKGELLFGLAEGSARAGDTHKARDYFMRLTKEAAASGRASYAALWLEGKPPANVGRCTGCH
jgi:tetratricopeptide (TPR) repeat protein